MPLDQTYASCKYRKLSWGLRVGLKNLTSLHWHCLFCVWSNFKAWVVTIEWYTRPSEMFMFPFGIFLLSASRNSSSGKLQLLKQRFLSQEWGTLWQRRMSWDFGARRVVKTTANIDWDFTRSGPSVLHALFPLACATILEGSYISCPHFQRRKLVLHEFGEQAWCHRGRR